MEAPRVFFRRGRDCDGVGDAPAFLLSSVGILDCFRIETVALGVDSDCGSSWGIFDCLRLDADVEDLGREAFVVGVDSCLDARL